MQKKYELIKTNKYVVKDNLEQSRAYLYQVRALKNFGNVKAGDLGGYVESEYNLSQQGNAWICGEAKVYDNAMVYDNAIVGGDARVYGCAEIYGNALVGGNAEVYDEAKVYEDAAVYDKAKVRGLAQICGGARVVDKTEVRGYAKVYGKTEIGGGAVVDAELLFETVSISGNVRIESEGKIGIGRTFIRDIYESDDETDLQDENK